MLRIGYTSVICLFNILKDKNEKTWKIEVSFARILFKTSYFINPLSANITKWSNTLKQFIGNLLTNCLSVFDHFVIVALKGLRYCIETSWLNQSKPILTRFNFNLDLTYLQQLDFIKKTYQKPIAKRFRSRRSTCENFCFDNQMWKYLIKRERFSSNTNKKLNM